MSSSKESDKDPSRKLKIQKRPELTNGGSLEDCISNVYSLLELPGIKWKCFRTKPNAPRGAPLTTELVLKAYSKCLLDGILCTWRRKQLTVNGSHELPLPIFNNDTPKELWVFWYNDEPVEIQKHCEGLEVDEEVSSANQMNLVSYEVRTILFKALHVVLERDLTKDGYVRFGRWFTVPLEPREHYLHYMYPTYSPAIRLNFFVHGSSTVCASVQAQRQPTLLTLARRHLEHKSAKTVIVGPWSMRGTLVPNQFSLLKDPKMQERAEKEWNHWNEYLQMEEKEPEVVPDTEKRSSPEPDTPQPLPHRSLLIDSSDEEVVPSAEPVAEPTSEEIPARMKWMYEPEIRTDKPKEETAEEKEKREKAREVRRKRRKAREERRKELERKRTENTNPDEYDSEVVTDPEEDNSEELVNNEVPRMVLLDIDGVRMLYPTKFICVTLEDDRQVLEAVGLKPNTIPEELQGKGRRPRNRFVVNVANPILSTQAVWQYCKTEKGSIYDKVVINPSAHGYTQPMAPIKRKLVQWRYLNRRKPCDGGNVCPACKFHKRRAKQIGTFTLDAADSKCLYKDMINRVRRKHDFEAFHKKHNVRVKPMSRRVRRRVKRKNRKMRLRRLDAERKIKRKPKYIMSLKRQRRIAEKEEEIQKKLEEDELKELKEITDKDELRPNDTLRGDSEDEYQMDKLSKNDWAHLGEKGKEPPPKVVDEDGVEKEPDIFNSIRIAKPPHDENYKPEPFLPVSVISRKTFGDFEYKAGDEDMSEERFNEVYHDKSGKWRPGMSRAEKIECADFQFDPANQQKEPHMPYHLKEAPKKIKWEAKLPMPRNNKYFKGAICRRGLRGYNDMIERVDKAKAMKKALYLRKYGRSKRKFQRKLAMWCSKKLVRQLSGRSLDKAVKNLRKIAEKDNRSDGTKQYKLSVAARKKKYEDKKKEAAKKKKPLVEDALHKLNVDSFCARFEKDGPHGEGMAVGYIPPDYATSPNSHVDEDTDPETEEQINGLGEGTSGQYQDGEPVDVDMEPQYVEEPNMEVAVAVSHVRSAGEHIGPEGLLSPPASNEMPKGGPLSVGPPSIESQGLNQIYPTPPSVQMLQGDAAQAHSPILHGKARYVGATEDDVERIAVPGGGGTIVEIEADDDETENMKKWNGKSTQSKMSKFLASSSKDPVLTARQKKYTTPMTEKFKIVEEAPKVPNRLVYTEMVRKKFGCAPHHHFAELVRSKLHEKRSVPSSAPVGPNLHPQMFPQASPLVPMFQTPSMPSHTPSSSVGPMGHHSMAGHGFPGTPGPFPPTTPTYSGMMSRPGYGPGPGYPNHHQMMPPGYSGPMGQRTPFMSPPNVMATQQQMHMARMQQMMQNRQMSVQGMPPGYGAPGIPHYPPGPGTPGPSGYGMQHQVTSSVQQLNQFVNHPRFGANGPHPGHPPPYGALQSMVPQSPSFNQPFGGMNNSMMSPMQQHQFHQQQMQQQQQMQMQQHQHQMQRNQMHNQQQLAQQQSIGPPTPQHLHFQTSMQWKAAHNQLNKRQVHKFKLRQIQLIRGVRPTSLQPVSFRKIRNQPDANIPINKQNLAPPLLPDLNVPEGDSLTIAIMLSDTILDLHFDSVFDACPICACSVSIRSRDLGMYITPHEVLRPRSHNMMGPSHSNMREHTVGAWSGFHHVNSGTNCTCGFSAIRHRYLSCCTGLFAEDANEATNLNNAVAAVVPPMNYPKRGTSRNMSWFDSRSVHDLALLDQIRQMSFSNSLGKAVSQMASVAEHRRDLNKAVEVTMDITDPSEYVISNVDSMELRILGKSAINTCMKTPTLRHHKEPPNQMYQFLQYFHPWGLQTANEITELESNEWVDLLETMTSTLGSAMKQAKRNTTDTDAAVEGPLTWKNFVTKSTFIKGKPNAEEEEDMSLAEPIPAVMRATAKEAIRTAPHIDQYYDLAGLGPVDQPKDVMYITVIPDDDVIYERTVRFMDQITETYERMKLGHHVPFPISTKTATRFRELYKENQVDFNLPDQHVQLVSYVNQLLRREHQLTVPEKNPVNNRPEYWERIDELRRNANENLNKGPGEDFGQEYNGTHEEFSHPTESFKKILGARKNKKLRQPDFFDREGILRVGTPCEPIRTPLNQTVTSTAEFSNMTKHLRDAHGFVTKLRIYLQQMEDLVTNALDENKEAFERHGYRYQLAVEARLKRKEHKRKKEEEFHRYNAAKKIDDLAAKNPQTQDDLDDLEELKQLIPGFEFLDDEATDYVDEEEEDRKRKKQKEDEQYPPEGPQAPSPIPAGMVHIPETLSEQERATQPSLADLMSDPNSVLPHNAANISWTQRDTSVPNPFPSSNQPPVPFESVGSADTDDHATLPHVIVIYMVNPFNYGPEGHNALHMRIAIISFIRVFNAIMGRLPFSKRPQLQLEIVGMESMDMVSKPMPDYFNDARIPFDILHERSSSIDKPSDTTKESVTRSLAVAVYTHPRVFFPDVYKGVASARCMTAFGPGSEIVNILQELKNLNEDSFARQRQRSQTHHQVMMPSVFGHPSMVMPQRQRVEKKNYIAYRIPSTIVSLAPPPLVCQMKENAKPQLHSVDEQTLFVSYCLVGTDFLVATATDAQGKLIDNCIANIKPRRQNNELYRYRNKTQILDGMGKLWNFILGIMSSEIKNWRLVVGRLGRIGHGEFRAWTHLLNKTSLLRYSSSLKDICGACRSMPSIVGTPAILSACLITLEPEPNIRIIPDYYDPDISAKKNSLFHTPGDLSCTHILTFPVGAEINLEVQDHAADPKAEENWEFGDLGDLDIMEGLDDGDTEIMKDLGLETPNSAAIRQLGGSSMFFSEDSSTIEIQNQPLASGYYISTAPAPELPTWFWATCPSARRHSPVHLKSSLHINISEVKNDDIAMESTKEKDKDKEKEEVYTHPLESRQTEEVLRHVLESYNALSWLNMNRENGDRYSCLPIHIQHLLRLYHSVARLLV